MLKKTITYTDYNGVERTEDHYFNISRSELAIMNYSEAGGLPDRLRSILNAKDSKAILNVVLSLVEMSYGVKSQDGRRFIKSKEAFEEFKQTEAYSNFILELLTSNDAATEFVKGILPNDLSAEIDKELAKNNGVPRLN